MLRKILPILMVSGALAVGPQAIAHHSTAAFDMSSSVELQGTIRSYQWSNPHSYIQVTVADGRGGTREWAIESGAPELGLRLGWTKTTLKPGDRVTMKVAPLRNGQPGQGVLVSCTLANGRTLYGPGYRPQRRSN